MDEAFRAFFLKKKHDGPRIVVYKTLPRERQCVGLIRRLGIVERVSLLICYCHSEYLSDSLLFGEITEAGTSGSRQVIVRFRQAKPAAIASDRPAGDSGFLPARQPNPDLTLGHLIVPSRLQ
jgi:hypothetical protein